MRTTTVPLFLILTIMTSGGCGDGRGTPVAADEAALTPTCTAACTTGTVCATSCLSGKTLTTCGSGGFACSGGPAGDAVTCYDNGNLPAFTTATSWSQLTGDQQKQLTAWMDAAARNWAGGSLVSATPIAATSKGDGFFRFVGSAIGASDLGMVVWNNAANCAYFVSTSDKLVPSSARALYDRWNALGGQRGALGLPVSNAKRRDSVDAYDNTYQQFADGIITFRSAETVAHALGGADVASRALAREYMADQGITKTLRPKLATALASDQTCIPSAAGAVCSASDGLGFRADSYATSTDANPRHYFAERGSSAAFTVKGTTGAKYFALSRAYGGAAPWTLIGFPTEDSRCADGKCSAIVQQFARANIFAKSAAAPAFVVDGDLLGAYLAEGGSEGMLGLPVEDSPSLGGSGGIERMQRFNGGTLHTYQGGWTVAPPPPGPSQLFLTRNSAKPDPDHPETDHAIGLTWYSPSATPTSIYRQTCDGNMPQPSCSAWTDIADLGTVGSGTQGWTDANAVMNTQNCYYVAQPAAQTNSQIQCAFTRDGLAHVPSRLQLAVTVGPGASDVTDDAVYARLQGVYGYPQGNITWLDTNLADFAVAGQRYIFDLLTFGKVNDLSDITDITVGVAGSNALCIAKMELYVDDCGKSDGCGDNHLAYVKDYLADTGHCATAVGSDGNGNGGTLVTASFHDLRSSPDWIRETTPGPFETPGHGWPLGHFMGIYDGNALRAFLMGLAANSLRSHDITYQDSQAPIELTPIKSPVSPGGASDEVLRIKAHVHKICDAWAQVDVRLTSTCTCNASGQMVVSKVGLSLENGSGDVESTICELGEDLLSLVSGIFTLGYHEFDDWLQDLIQEKILHALGGGKNLTYDLPPGVHFGFTNLVGFNVTAGTVCDIDETNGACQ